MTQIGFFAYGDGLPAAGGGFGAFQWFETEMAMLTVKAADVAQFSVDEHGSAVGKIGKSLSPSPVNVQRRHSPLTAATSSESTRYYARLQSWKLLKLSVRSIGIFDECPLPPHNLANHVPGVHAGFDDFLWCVLQYLENNRAIKPNVFQPAENGFHIQAVSVVETDRKLLSETLGGYSEDC